jgi:hypothetical protein
MGFGLKLGNGLPVEPAAAARKIYNIQQIYLRIGDQLDQVLEGIDLSLMDPTAGRSCESTFRSALITAFQYLERLPDPLAELATTSRMDWKYALRLPVQHPGISAEALCAFRRNLIAFPNSAREFSRFLAALSAYGLFSKSTSQSLSTGEVLETVCTITRIYELHQGMSNAVSELAACEPEWLGSVALPHWYEHYKNTVSGDSRFYLSQDESTRIATNLGADALQLLMALREQSLFEYTHLSEVNQLDRLFNENYAQNSAEILWGTAGCSGCSRIG